MDYHIFKKPVKSKNKITHRWYYYFIDPISGKQIQKVCKKCKTQAEAYAYVSSLPPIFRKEIITISTITKWMFVPGSEHVERLFKFGKALNVKTLAIKRHFLDIFTEQFGDLTLDQLTDPMIINYLMDLGDSKSGSWKNNFLTVVGNVYEEAPFHGVNNIPKPTFPKFARNTKKADIFTTDELNRLFDEDVWRRINEKSFVKYNKRYDVGYHSVYLMFLCIATCGLRLGEALGLRAKQFLFNEGMLVIDGFYRSDEKERTNFNKKGSAENQKLRVVPLSETLGNMVQSYINENGVKPDDFVFTRHGNPINKKTAEHWFYQALNESGIEVGERKLVPHSLRYTYVTRMRRNVSGETVQKLVGHTSIAMTEYYTRAAIPELVAALQGAKPAVEGLFE